VVEKWKSSIRMLEKLLDTTRGVRSDTKDFRSAPKVMRRQEAIQVLELVVDRGQRQIVRYGFESRLDIGELGMELPEIFWVSLTEIGAQ
jgi:hypothetical protein